MKPLGVPRRMILSRDLQLHGERSEDRYQESFEKECQQTCP
jgi:hypothetical protein